MAVDTGKKRKRDGVPAGEEKKKKKKVSIVETASTTKEATVMRVSKVVQPQFSAPVIGLCVPDSIQFDSFSRASRRSSSKRAAKQPTDPSAEMLLHSSAHRTVDLTGKEDKSSSADASLNHYLGVFDPATGQLQVVAAKKMEIRGRVRARDATAEQMTGTALGTGKTRVDQRNELGETFGTRKAKKAILSLTENAIASRRRNADGSFQAVAMGDGDRALLETMAPATASMSTREQLQAAVDKAKPVPRGNFAAEAVQDVYEPAQIIGADVLAAVPVRDWQQATRAGEPVELFSQFVAQRMAALARRADDDAHAVARLRLLRYLYWLILYWQAARPGRERGTKRQPPRDKLAPQMHDAPDAVIESIRRLFTDNGTLRKFHIDLLMTHCCVFALVVDNFEVDMVDLREDLRLEQKQMAQYFSEVGARIKVVKSEDRVSYFAKLQLPLRFPNGARQRRQR